MRLLLRLLTFLIAATFLGLASAWYMINHGSALTLQHVGPWSTWVSAGNPTADPYTRAHFARSGRLPITSTSARYYIAKTDSSGGTLDLSCEYIISGSKIDSTWWSIAAYNKAGNILKNKAKRYSYNKLDIFTDDEDYKIILAQNARSGNWLPLSGSGAFQIMFRIYRADITEDLFSLEKAKEILPEITRVDC